MTGRVARLAARVDALEQSMVEVSARVKRLGLFTKVPTTLDAARPPHLSGEDGGRAS